jgi:hypothetical protein
MYPKSFRTGSLERKLQMVLLSATRCSGIAILCQSSEFCRHKPLCCFSTSVYCCCLFRYRLSPENFRYTLIFGLSNCWTLSIVPIFFLEHDVSETGSVSVFRCGTGRAYSVQSLKLHFKFCLSFYQHMSSIIFNAILPIISC